MVIVLIGLIIGLVVGFYLPVSFSTSYSIYLSVAILAAIDSVFGAFRSNLESRFDSLVFITGFFSNAILAGLLAYIGDVLGIPLYYAAIFVFGIRLFNNLAIIRRIYLDRLKSALKRKGDQGIMSKSIVPEGETDPSNPA